MKIHANNLNLSNIHKEKAKNLVDSAIEITLIPNHEAHFLQSEVQVIMLVSLIKRIWEIKPLS